MLESPFFLIGCLVNVVNLNPYERNANWKINELNNKKVVFLVKIHLTMIVILLHLFTVKLFNRLCWMTPKSLSCKKSFVCASILFSLFSSTIGVFLWNKIFALHNFYHRNDAAYQFSSTSIHFKCNSEISHRFYPSIRVSLNIFRKDFHIIMRCV